MQNVSTNNISENVITIGIVTNIHFRSPQTKKRLPNSVRRQDSSNFCKMSSQRKQSSDVGSPVDPSNAGNGNTKITGHPCNIIYRPCERPPPPVEERSLEIPEDSTSKIKRPCPPKLYGPCPSSPWLPGKHKAGLNRAQAMEAEQQDQPAE